MISINRSTTVLKANPKRVILLFNDLGISSYVTSNRSQALVNRAMSLTEETVESLYEELLDQFSHRHKNIEHTFLKHYKKVKFLIPPDTAISEKRSKLLGAYFSKEYSIQSAALFNPSIVPHPYQENLNEGEKRIIISLRSVGEGHISSIEFREGIVSAEGKISLEPETAFTSCSEKDLNFEYNRNQLKERTSIISNLNQNIFDKLPDTFTLKEYTDRFHRNAFTEYDDLTQKFMDELVDTNYDIEFNADTAISERVVFPSAKGESMGMEDVRFVEFTHEDGKKEYIGTYTAYNGHKITPQLIITKDFIHFEVRTMFGKAVSDKGFALFPEKISGQFMMTARQGGENLTIMTSDDLYNWENYEVIMEPEYGWGLVQQGNCGSPIKTDKGWLLITHAVGPLRKYTISAVLLDLDNPGKIIGKLKEPLISPNEDEREGYVPNVVYSCGAMIHNKNLIIPYAMSDSASSFASISVDEILNNMMI